MTAFFNGPNAILRNSRRTSTFHRRIYRRSESKHARRRDSLPERWTVIELWRTKLRETTNGTWKTRAIDCQWMRKIVWKGRTGPGECARMTATHVLLTCEQPSPLSPSLLHRFPSPLLAVSLLPMAGACLWYSTNREATVAEGSFPVQLATNFKRSRANEKRQ